MNLFPVEIYSKAERHHVALKYAEQANQAYPENVDFLLKYLNHCIPLLMSMSLLVSCYTWYIQLGFRVAECNLANNSPQKALDLFLNASKTLRGSKMASTDVKHRIQVRCLYSSHCLVHVHIHVVLLFFSLGCVAVTTSCSGATWLSR